MLGVLKKPVGGSWWSSAVTHTPTLEYHSSEEPRAFHKGLSCDRKAHWDHWAEDNSLGFCLRARGGI